MGFRNLAVLLAITFLLSAASTWLAYKGVDQPVIGIDDANIFFAYAQNIAAGEGFVYYPMGERVEGFTSLLWVLVCALATLLCGRRELLLLGINVGVVALTVASAGQFVWRELSDRGGGARYAFYGTTAVLFWAFISPSYICWSTISLMDTAIWGGVFTLGSLLASRSVDASRSWPQRRASGLSACVAVALITRPESMLIAAVWIGSAAFATFVLIGDIRESLRRYVRPTVTYILTLGALVTFRMVYFHYPLPNTYYAKVSPSLSYNLSTGARYFWGFVLSQPFVILCLGASLASVVQFVSRTRQPVTTPEGEPMPAAARSSARIFVISCSILTGVLVPVLSGGDHFVCFRFYQPIWPLLSVPLILAVASAIPESAARNMFPVKTRGIAWFFLALTCVYFYSGTQTRWDHVLRNKEEVLDFAHQIVIATDGRRLGLELNRLIAVDPSLSIGVIAAGGVAVTFKGTTIDLMGLNNVKMGHSAGDRRGIKNHAAFNEEVFYELKPDLVTPRLVNGTIPVDDPRPSKRKVGPDFLKGLLVTHRFKSDYSLTRTPLREGNQWIIAWAKNDVVARLKEGGIAIEIIPYQVETKATRPPNRLDDRAERVD